MAIDKAMQDLQRIKEECSLHWLSLTPEERDRENAEIIKRAEAAMGRKLTVLKEPSAVEATEAELAQV
jgi:hypothetical protein